MAKQILLTLVLTLLAFNLSACGVIDYFYLPPPENTAQELFENGNDAMREKNYMSAIGYYTKLKESFPFSAYSKEAEISLGDAYYLDGEYLLASEAYKDFEAMHPRDEATPYVLLQIANSNIQSYNSIDRPTTALVEAEAYLRRVSESYPGSEYSQRAAELLAQCRRTMAEHELYLGDLFMSMGKYNAAWKRYTALANNFSDIEDLSAHAREKSKEAYIKHLDLSAETKKDVQESGMWKTFKDWL